MKGVLRLSEAASIGLHGALALAAAPDRYWSAREVGARFGFSADHVTKVMRALGRAGLVVATRGPGGGVRLGRPAGDITLLAIYEALDGPLAAGGCLLSPQVCRARCCTLGPQLASVNRQVHDLFARTTLADLARGFKLPPAARRPGSVRPPETRKTRP